MTDMRRTLIEKLWDIINVLSHQMVSVLQSADSNWKPNPDIAEDYSKNLKTLIDELKKIIKNDNKLTDEIIKQLYEIIKWDKSFNWTGLASEISKLYFDEFNWDEENSWDEEDEESDMTKEKYLLENIHSIITWIVVHKANKLLWNF